MHSLISLVHSDVCSRRLSCGTGLPIRARQHISMQSQWPLEQRLSLMPIPKSATPLIARSRVKRARDMEKPMRLVLKMRDAAYRPIILTVADALATMVEEKLNPIGHLRGGSTPITSYRGCFGARAWIEGETEYERFRIAIPTSSSLSGRNFDGHTVERPITSFNGATILCNGSVRLADCWLQCVKFHIPPMRFILTAVETRIAELVSEFSNSKGHNLPIDWVDFVRLGNVNWSYSLPPLVDFIGQHWCRDGQPLIPPPSRETIVDTLDALFVRKRARAN